MIMLIFDSTTHWPKNMIKVNNERDTLRDLFTKSSILGIIHLVRAQGVSNICFSEKIT